MPNYWTPYPRPQKGHRVPIGKARIDAEGSDITIVSYARMVNECRTALKTLEEAGISAELIDLRSVSPWDKEALLASVRKTGRLLIVHEAVVPFGVGAEIAAVIGEALFGTLKAPIARVGAPFNPVPFSRPLEMAHIPNAEGIAKAAIAVVKGQL